MTPEERAKWDIDPDDWPHSPPLHVFRELMDEDDNLWWRAGSGYGLNAYEQAIEEVDRLVAGIEAVRALHPRKDNPTSGCCARPKLCNGHGPVCNGREHGVYKPEWPCPTIRTLDDLLPTREQEGDR